MSKIVKNMMKKWMLLRVFIVLVVLSNCSQIVKAQEKIVDQIVATVDNYIVLESDIERMYLNLLYEKKISSDNPEKAKCQILEQLVIQKMMLAKAEIDSVIVEEKEVNSQLDRRIAYLLNGFGGNVELLEKQYNKTLNDIKQELFEGIKEQMTVQKMERTITEKIKITPKEVKRFFDGFPRDSLPYFNAEVEVSHIVKIPEVSKEQKRVVKERLEAIRERIMNGEDFGELAERYSEDYSSAKEKGNLRWNQRGNLVPEFEAVVFKLKPNEVSKPVESQYGFHLIKLIERRGNEYNASHILLRPNFEDVDTESAQNYLDSLRTRILQDSISFEKAAKEYSDDKFTSTDGGKIRSNSTGEYKMFVDELEPTVYFVIDTMKVGSISNPVPYRTDDGRTGLRILYFKSKTEPHQASISEDYQKIYNFALVNKKNTAINEWFRKTKNQLYINIDPKYKDCILLQESSD